jgi:hypothetical protein
MGRPLQKKYFGNKNPGATSTESDDYGIGGKYVSAIATGTAGSGYSQGLTATVGVPDLPTGVRATTTVGVYTANGAVSGYTLVEPGSGYTAAPSITLVKPGNVNLAAGNVTTAGGNVLTVSSTSGIYVGMAVVDTTAGGNIASAPRTVTSIDTANSNVTVTGAGIPNANVAADAIRFYDAGASGAAGTVTLAGYSTSASNAFTFTSNIGGDTSSADIIKQVNARTFYIQTANGNVGRARLTTNSSVVSGEMRITASDSVNGTYFVSKISNLVATLVKSSGNGTQFTDGSKVHWTLGSAVLNESVKLPSA